jgi:hypothetical protein
VLDALYPPERPRLLRLRVRSPGATRGWAVVMVTKARAHKHFGTLRVGTIVDCLAAPADARAVLEGATATLRAEGAQLIVTNQSHAGWVAACRRVGFLPGPSNYLYGASPALTKRAAIERHARGIGITRGDGDGIVNL